MVRPKAAQVIAAAGAAICVPDRQRAIAAQLLAGDAARFEALLAEMNACDTRLAEVLPDTPAQVLTSIPGVGVLTASYYSAALGDVHRFANADAAYRHSGLAPTAYESAGRRSGKVHISKTGSVELRQAIIALGNGITLHHPDFAAYKRAEPVRHGHRRGDQNDVTGPPAHHNPGRRPAKTPRLERGRRWHRPERRR